MDKRIFFKCQIPPTEKRLPAKSEVLFGILRSETLARSNPKSSQFLKTAQLAERKKHIENIQFEIRMN